MDYLYIFLLKIIANQLDRAQLLCTVDCDVIACLYLGGKIWVPWVVQHAVALPRKIRLSTNNRTTMLQTLLHIYDCKLTHLDDCQCNVCLSNKHVSMTVLCARARDLTYSRCLLTACATPGAQEAQPTSEDTNMLMHTIAWRHQAHSTQGYQNVK